MNLTTRLINKFITEEKQNNAAHLILENNKLIQALGLMLIEFSHQAVETNELYAISLAKNVLKESSRSSS